MAKSAILMLPRRLTGRTHVVKAGFEHGVVGRRGHEICEPDGLSAKAVKRPPMERTYHHPSAEKRAVITIAHSRAESLCAIALLLDWRRVSGLFREVARNRPLEAAFALKRVFVHHATVAATAYRLRRRNWVSARKLEERTALVQHVRYRIIHCRWS